jgi:two-component system OmpR family sensor kinase
MSLRARLLVVVLAMVAVGLVATDMATAATLRSYLLRRIDEQLDTVQPFVNRRFDSGQAPGSAATANPVADAAPRVRGRVGPLPNLELFAERISGDGTVSSEFRGSFRTGPSPLAGLGQARVQAARQGQVQRFNATLNGATYRVDIRPLARTTDVSVAAIPVGDLTETLHRLYAVEGGATVAVLLLAGLIGLWLVRVGLRPLDHMADTAEAIAGGDPTRRVGVEGGGTEVARLGQAMNAAFDARQASEERLRRFVADASHELRTPLTSIRGYAELFRAGALGRPEDGAVSPAQSDARAQALRRIEDEAARMGGLIDDLLLLARLDQGRPFDRRPVDLSVLAADAVADARAVEPGRAVTFEATGPVMVEGDEPRLRQVLANLLANTSEHTPPGTPVHVRLDVLGRDAVLEVADEGPGLPVEQAGLAFDRFWRADEARGHHTGQVGGSGLGLSIVAAVAAAHGGRAWVADPGRPGARFCVAFPVAAPSAASQPLASHS